MADKKCCKHDPITSAILNMERYLQEVRLNRMLLVLDIKAIKKEDLKYPADIYARLDDAIGSYREDQGVLEEKVVEGIIGILKDLISK